MVKILIIVTTLIISVIKNINGCTWTNVHSENSGGTGDMSTRFLDFSTSDPEYIEFYKLEWTKDSTNKEIIFKTIEPNERIFGDNGNINQNIPISVTSKTNVNVISLGNNYFCKSVSDSSTNKYGDTSWGIVPLTDTHRNCGCNSGTWTGSGVYYGGYPSGECNVCDCHGGGFSGEKSNGEAKGGLVSLGFKFSVCVSTTKKPTKTPTTKKPTKSPVVGETTTTQGEGDVSSDDGSSEDYRSNKDNPDDENDGIDDDMTTGWYGWNRRLEDKMSIWIRIDDREFEIGVEISDFIEDIKFDIEEIFDIPLKEQTLMFGDEILLDGYTLDDYSIQNGDTIELILK